MANTTTDELIGIDAEGERLFLRAHAPREGDLALLHAEGLEQALLRLIVHGAKELDGPEDADAHERVAQAPAEAREHRERHLELHPQHLPALDQELSEQLLLLGRRHALGRTLDEEDALLPRPVAQDERASLAPYRQVKDARRQASRIEASRSIASAGRSASHLSAGLFMKRAISGYAVAGLKRPCSRAIVQRLPASPVAYISMSPGSPIGPTMVPSSRWTR